MNLIKVPKKDAYLGYHFLPTDRRLRNSDGRRVVLGETLVVHHNKHNPIAACTWGLHASPTLFSAVACWHDVAGLGEPALLCRVLLWGHVDISKAEHCQEKVCGSKRLVVWWHKVRLLPDPDPDFDGYPNYRRLASQLEKELDRIGKFKLDPKRKGGRWVL